MNPSRSASCRRWAARFAGFVALLSGAATIDAHDGGASQAIFTSNDYWVSPAVSGSWFDAERSGEGFALELLPDGTAVVVWFTYPPAGAPGEQAWILGQGGVVEGDRIRFQQVYTARGARFGQAFDPADVVLTPWGSLELEFADCRNATVRWQGPSNFGSGERSLGRLTELDELQCFGDRRLTPLGARAASALKARGGAYLNPLGPGEGFVVEPLSETLAGFYWFTYDNAGNAAWLIGVGQFDGDTLTVDTLRPVGTRFGANFVAADVQRNAWGRVTIQFTECNRANVQWEPTATGFNGGSRDLVRLTTLAGAPCIDTLPDATITGSWSQGPALDSAESETAATVLDGRMYVVGGYSGRRTFQRFDFATGTWTRLADLPAGRDHAMAQSVAGAVYAFGGYLPLGVDDAPLFKYDVASNTWASVTGVPYASASGSAFLNGRFYVGDADGDLFEFEPATGNSRLIPAFDATERDHSQVVAFLGEIWMIGGRSLPTFEQSRVTIYNPVTGEWRTGPSLREARAGFAASVLGNRIVVAGGERVYRTPRLVITSMESIAAGSNAWTLGAPTPVAVHGVPGVVHAGRWYLPGGSTVAAIGAPTPVLQVFTPTN